MIWFFTAIVAAELAVGSLIWWLRRGCQWLITKRDLSPEINDKGLERFLAHGWDNYLGWVRKPNTLHDEAGPKGTLTKYHIDAHGARWNPGFDRQKTVALVVGDSYAFCRQVNDDETWPHFLSGKMGGYVANYGVGNYGMDQAVLRLEMVYRGAQAPVVMMAVVPETICRVLSVWRHFSEYGNTLAFKPRFKLDEVGELKLVPNPVSKVQSFLRIKQMLPLLMEQDFFFARKFKPDMLQFPYLWHLWRSRRRNIPLMWAALRDRFSRDGKHVFCRVMDRNIRLAAELYQEPEPVDLLVDITLRFAEFVSANGAKPVLVMLPQLYDLRHIRCGNHYYAGFLARVSNFCHVIDFGPRFAEAHDDAVNYIDDRYGGHFSVRGNEIVADEIMRAL